MSAELREGVALNAVHCASGPEGMSYVVDWPDSGGQLVASCESIVVVEQTGQMAMVPWAKVVLQTGAILLVNLAHVESVELKND